MKISMKEKRSEENAGLIYDQAFELARLLQQSDEYLLYSSAKESLQSNNKSAYMLSQFRHRQLRLHVAQFSGEDVEEDMGELEESFDSMCNDPVISAFVDAEGKFTRLLADVQKIVGNALNMWPGFEFAWQSANENLN
ncbi:MAG: YlbF family regulator [Clostridiales bacterium]|nr:YlbF family regulator [Clostridiales bacterium]